MLHQLWGTTKLLPWMPTDHEPPAQSCALLREITTTFAVDITKVCMLRQIFVWNATGERSRSTLLAHINVFIGFVMKKETDSKIWSFHQ